MIVADLWLINQTEFSTISAYPNFVCFLKEGSVKGTNSSDGLVWYFCVYILFHICVWIDFIFLHIQLQRGFTYEKSFDMCL